VEPIQQLPKTSERMYAKYLGIPEGIISKAPTAGLWEGQTDEGELGMTYENMDKVMVGYMLGFTLEEIAEVNSLEKRPVEAIVNLSKKNEFKAKPEPYAKLAEEEWS